MRHYWCSGSKYIFSLQKKSQIRLVFDTSLLQYKYCLLTLYLPWLYQKIQLYYVFGFCILVRNGRQTQRWLNIDPVSWEKLERESSTVFENHKKVAFLTLRAKRFKFAFEWTKVHEKCQKWSKCDIFGDFQTLWSRCKNCILPKPTIPKSSSVRRVRMWRIFLVFSIFSFLLHVSMPDV